MTELKAMKAVYCYFFPEVRPLLREVPHAIPGSMYLVTTPAEEVYKSLEQLFSPPLEIPATPEGYVNMDEIHVPITKRIVSAYLPLVPNLGDFKYNYPTSGSSEGIREVLKKIQTDGTKAINVLDGEYEGYSEYAKAYGIGVNSIEPDETDLRKLQSGVWFISNPSARDGNIIPNDLIRNLCDAGHRVVLDLAYVGATRPYEFDVSHENIPAVVMSFSKPYGVFRFRAGGFAFSRDEIPALYGNKWFKDTERLFDALKIAENLGPRKDGSTPLFEKYRNVQEEIVKELNKEFGLGMRLSDSFLLGHLTREDAEKLSHEQLELVKPFRRGSGYRFCLTPYFEERERGGRF